MHLSKFACLLSAVALAVSPAIALAHDHGHGHNHSHGHNHAHHHHHTAPHGGTLVVLGEEAAHVELLLDNKEGQLTAYVLDAEAEKAIRIVQPEIEMVLSGKDAKTTVPLKLAAVSNPLTGEKVGDSSEFAVKDDKLKNLKRFDVTIKSITLRGVKFDNVKSPFPEGNH